MDYSILEYIDPVLQASRMTAFVTGVLVFIDSLTVILYHYGFYEKRPLHEESALSMAVAWLFLAAVGAAAGALLLTLPNGLALAETASPVRSLSVCLVWIGLALAFTTRSAAGSRKKMYIWLTSFAIFSSFLVIASIS